MDYTVDDKVHLLEYKCRVARPIKIQPGKKSTIVKIMDQEVMYVYPKQENNHKNPSILFPFHLQHGFLAKKPLIINLKSLWKCRINLFGIW